MIRKDIVLITIILVITVTGISQAQMVYPPQIQYELEIWELVNEEQRKLALEAFEYSPESIGFEILTRPNLGTILGGIPFQLTVPNSQELSRLATPAVIVTLGQEAVLQVVEETLMPALSIEEAYYETRGIKIKVTPLMLNETSGEIFSQLDINTYDPDNRIKTNMLIQSGTKLPVAIVHFANETKDESEDRVFTVLVKAEIVNQPDKEAAVAIGGLGGMGNLFWPDQINLEQDNYIWIALPLNPIPIPEGGLKFWVGPRVYINAEIKGESFSNKQMSLGFQLLPEGLNVEAHLITEGEHNMIALGLSDRVEAAPGLYLSGGILPAVFKLDDFNQMKMRWWGEADITFQPVQITMRYNSNGDSGTLESEVGYAVTENSKIFARFSMSEDGHTKLASGIRFTF